LSNRVSEQEDFGGGERLSKIAFKERERHAKSLKDFARFATGLFRPRTPREEISNFQFVAHI